MYSNARLIEGGRARFAPYLELNQRPLSTRFSSRFGFITFDVTSYGTVPVLVVLLRYFCKFHLGGEG